MAKRRRLDPLPQSLPDPAAPGLVPGLGADPLPSPAPSRAPIAQVAGDGARAAALEELAETLSVARAEGRLIQHLPLEAIDDSYLLRDRLADALLAEEPEMAALTASLAERGQQVAIEVADLGEGHSPRYGLIAGWRRLTALRRLAQEGRGPETVLAIARPPGEAAEAYRAMVEENEIRAGLSYYERARIVARAADAGVFPDDRAALAALFASASRPRRSKIGSFLRIIRALEGEEGPALAFPAQLSERTGLALATALDGDPDLAGRLCEGLRQSPPASPEEETARIAAAIAGKAEIRGRADVPVRILGGYHGGVEVTEPGPDRVVLKGAALRDADFRRKLFDWLQKNG